jgi:uncharacterized protein (TIGR03437 family)
MKFTQALPRLLTLLMFVPFLSAQLPTVTGIVNSANYSTHISLGSIISIFGNNLAASSTSATVAPFATSLAGTQVSACLSGFSSCLLLQIYYVSPGQINAIMPSVPRTSATIPPGIGPGSFQVIANGSTGPKFSVAIPREAPGIFQEGWDCPYPANCALSPIKTTTNSVLRGAVTDAFGILVSSKNPIEPGKEYVLYSTGSGYSSAIYLYFVANGKEAGVVTFPDYIGASPCCVGLDQTNFQIPSGMLRAFSIDDQSLPTCGSIKGDIQVEMTLVLQDLAFTEDSQDSISVPVHVKPGQLDCTPGA